LLHNYCFEENKLPLITIYLFVYMYVTIIVVEDVISELT